MSSLDRTVLLFLLCVAVCDGCCCCINNGCLLSIWFIGTLVGATVGSNESSALQFCCCCCCCGCCWGAIPLAVLPAAAILFDAHGLLDDVGDCIQFGLNELFIVAGCDGNAGKLFTKFCGCHVGCCETVCCCCCCAIGWGCAGDDHCSGGDASCDVRSTGMGVAFGWAGSGASTGWLCSNFEASCCLASLKANSTNH